ncbi:MAG: tetratricopeptide repeat protein [Planctomycetota bacterium]|jgi:tetratricopeptide (TPR) repeat protein
MAKENQQTIPEHSREAGAQDSTAEVPPDHELFAGDVHEELSEREVFAGDEDFYKRLSEPTQAAVITQSADESQSPLASFVPKRFSTVQKILAASIVVTGVMFLYALLKSPPAPVAGHAPKPTGRKTPAVRQTPSPQPPVIESTHTVPPQIQKAKTSLPPTHPLSLKVAQDFYLKEDYDNAYAAYHQLRQNLPDIAEEKLLRDFLQLKMALCMKKSGDTEQAGSLFKTVLQTHSPAIRAIANYHLSLFEMQKNQYLKARTRAYQTIALISAADFDTEQALSLQQDCHFLIAESMTRKILSLRNADKDIPEDLWSNRSQIEPFTNLSETQLRTLLSSGSELLSKGLLGPKIQILGHKSTSSPSWDQPHWSAICQKTSIEELLARFAANTDLDIHWAFARDSIGIRKRPVTLYLLAATAEQFVTAAAGCAGLFARLNEKGVVNIFNPTDYSLLAEHISLLSQEAISIWQRFLLTFHDDERIPNAHFALGLLQAQKGLLTDAIAEYKLVANRFVQTSLAPFALLHSSQLKTNLHDYFGARQDLKQLVEQYPDADITSRACLYLADATMKAQLYDEAARLYRKVYNLDSSLESQTASALGAAKCFYEKKDHESAAKWLTRYISLAKDRTSTELYSAYILLGETNLALGKPRQACEAFQHALTGDPEQLPKKEYLETVAALVKGHMGQEQFVEALDILENVHTWHLSQNESVELLLLNSRILQAMGLVDQAISILGDRIEYTSDPQLKAKISFELTKCYIAKSNFERAYRNLTEILVLVEPGPLAHEITLELAEVCSKLDRHSQTISVCYQLLDLEPSPQIKQKALDLLATAYSRQKNYDRAALVLLGRWSSAETPNEERTFDRPHTPKQSLHHAK